MSDFERRKDQVQEAISSTVGLVGRLTAITTDAVGSAAREVGDWISDGVEMREAAKLAREDEERRTQQDADGTAGSDDTEGGP